MNSSAIIYSHARLSRQLGKSRQNQKCDMPLTPRISTSARDKTKKNYKGHKQGPLFWSLASESQTMKITRQKNFCPEWTLWETKTKNNNQQCSNPTSHPTQALKWTLLSKWKCEENGMQQPHAIHHKTETTYHEQKTAFMNILIQRKSFTWDGKANPVPKTRYFSMCNASFRKLFQNINTEIEAVP